MKICPVVAELFRADRKRDMTKLEVAFQIMTQIEKEGSGRSPIIIIILKFHGSTKQLQSNTKIESGRDSNTVPPIFKSEAFPTEPVCSIKSSYLFRRISFSTNPE